MNNEKETKRTTRKTITLKHYAVRQENKDYLSRKVRITLLAVT